MSSNTKPESLENRSQETKDGGTGQKPETKQHIKLIPSSELEKMVSDSMHDDDIDADDDNVENDPELLRELKDITSGAKVAGDDTEGAPIENGAPLNSFLPTTALNTIDIIHRRIEMYKQADANAKSTGEDGKVRRFERGLKTLTELLKQAMSGETINKDDIPPEVIVKSASVDKTEEGSTNAGGNSVKN